MIDSLLSFSRLGRKELILSLVDIDYMIHEIIEQFKPDIGRRNIKWNITQLPKLRGDLGLLKIAFENLISNAIKYTSRKQKAIVWIGSKKFSINQTEIFIKDNGVGFDMEYADKLFGVFQRLHLAREFDGIGIGLANTKQIIEKHNGTIRAEAKVNKGAVFYIILPNN
jgi:light-regulated signal transduction histidine kinase (bacteriophytochrome)